MYRRHPEAGEWRVNMCSLMTKPACPKGRNVFMREVRLDPVMILGNGPQDSRDMLQIDWCSWFWEPFPRTAAMTNSGKSPL